MPSKPGQKNNQSRIQCTVDLSAPGRHVGDLQVRHSDNRQSLGVYSVPVISIKNGTGPKAIIIGGVHGDEFEGPVALMRLVHSLATDDISGQVIVLPGFNMPAVEASSRISPIDHVNMNRAFPGDPDGGPTLQLAHYLESVLFDQCDFAIDIHAGGKASVFAPSVLPTLTRDHALFSQNLELARHFGVPTVWLLAGFNDNRSVNSAAERQGVPMVAAELGGAGGSDPVMVEMAVNGTRNCLQHAGVLAGQPQPTGSPRIITIKSPKQNLYAPTRALFDRYLTAGDEVRAGDNVGQLFSIDEPDQKPRDVVSSVDGMVLAHCNRGFVEKGDMLALIGTDTDLPEGFSC